MEIRLAMKNSASSDLDDLDSPKSRHDDLCTRFTPRSEHDVQSFEASSDYTSRRLILLVLIAHPVPFTEVLHCATSNPHPKTRPQVSPRDVKTMKICAYDYSQYHEL